MMKTNSMRIFILPLIAFCFTLNLASQPKSNLSGIWLAKSGTPDNQGEAYFYFVHHGDSLKPTVSLPMYGDQFMNIPLPAVSLNSDTIRFPTFDGIYIQEKDQISANINFLYEAVPFILTRTGKIGSPLLDTAKVTNKPPAWVFHAGGRVWASPLIHNGQLFFGCDDSCFYSVETANGQLIRKLKTGGKVRGKAALFGSNLIFASDDGLVYCINSKTGKIIWKSRINDGKFNRTDPSMTDGTWDYALSSPIVSGKTVYVGSTDSSLYALDATTGNVRWKFKTDHIVRATPQASGELVYCGNWGGKCYALDKKSGKQMWIADFHQPILSQPAIENNRLVIGSRHAWLWCLDAQTGKEIWKYNYWWSWVESSPTIENGIIYIGSSDLRQVLAIDLVTGKNIWKFRTTGYSYSEASLDNSTVYMGSMISDPEGKSSGYLYLLDKATGKLQHKIEIPIDKPGFLNGVFGQIATDQNRFYAISLGGKIMVFNK